MRNLKKLTQRLDHSVPETTRRNREESDAFKEAMQKFILRRKQRN